MRITDGCEQGARLFLNVQFAQTGTTVVIGDGTGASGIDLVHPAYVGEEGDEFVAAFGQFARPVVPGGVGCQQRRVVFAQHAGAGAGRCDDVIKGLERRNHLPGDGAGIGPVAAVVGGLAAAGLCLGHGDRAAGLFQQFDRGKADAGTKQIHEAGDEQSNLHRG